MHLDLLVHTIGSVAPTAMQNLHKSNHKYGRLEKEEYLRNSLLDIIGISICQWVFRLWCSPIEWQMVMSLSYGVVPFS